MKGNEKYKFGIRGGSDHIPDILRERDIRLIDIARIKSELSGLDRMMLDALLGLGWLDCISINYKTVQRKLDTGRY